MSDSQLTIQDFTSHPEVQEVLRELHLHFNAHNPLVVSDVISEVKEKEDVKELQFVNLVQEGGGVLGVGLVGYTWILEEMGIRFYSLAGTSAGAINTLLIASMGQPVEKKSERILEELCKKDFFDFIDGTPMAKVLIRNIFTRANYIGDFKRKLIILFGTAIFIPVIGVLSMSLQNINDTHLQLFNIIIAGVTLLSWTMIMILFRVISILRKKFYKSGYGINPGKSFFDWIEAILKKYGTDTMESLYDKMMINQEDGSNVAKKISLKLRDTGADETRTLDDLPRKLAIITSDITIQTKIEFPQMAGMYWDNVRTTSPAHFVRASMSIPVFFEAYQVSIPKGSARVREAWKEMQNMNEEEIPTYARFIDGGMISNFPINIFHNPNQKIARLPTFGIKLDDLEDEEQSRIQFKETEQQFASFPGYLMAMFNTVRYYYDKDFLLKNQLYTSSIGVIDTSNINWLNFNLSKDEKIRLFIRGAVAAKNFLIAFNWEEYKQKRMEVMQEIKKN